MRRPLVTAVVAALSVGLMVAMAAPAHAATPAIELSRDGVAWAPALAAPLFAGSLLIPTGSSTRSFVIRNNAPEAGYLRLTLRDVSTDNLDYADALSLRADMAGWPGETISVGAARPCVRLAEGPVIAPGGTQEVDLTALLGQLDGLHGQRGHVAFQIVVTVSGEPLGLGVTGCPQTGAAIDGFDPVSTGSGSFARAIVEPHYVSTATGWISQTGMPSSTATILTPSGPTTGHRIDALRVSANTDRFYQERDVALWMLGALLGAAGAWALRRRPERRRPETRRPVRAVPDPGIHPKGAPR